MQTIQIEYKTSVLVNAGWRPVYVKAKAEKISDKRARVVGIVDVDDSGKTSGYLSRTGAKRQQYSASYIAKREVGAIKILSKCCKVEA